MKRYFFIAAFIGLIALFATHIAYRKNTVYPENDMQQLFDEVTQFNKKTGQKTIAIVTGSTSGIGQELAIELYRLGAVVIVASRSKAKCLDVIKDIKHAHPNGKGTLEVGVIDTSDLDSVKSFVTSFQNKYNHLNYLINNAGIHYMSSANSPLLNSSAEIGSKQGYDLSFATNYMGHFLLTNSLLPMMRDGRVVNIASTYHFQADGSTLHPPSVVSEDDSVGEEQSNNVEFSRTALLTLTAPSAARHENTTFRHRRIAYGVSKLAQVLHAKELQRRLDTDTFTVSVSGGNNDTSTSMENNATVSEGPRNVKIVSVCPGWVGTNILPPGPAGNFIRNNAFTARASILAPMCALLDSSLQGGEFVVNYQIPLTQHDYWSPLMFRVVTFLGIRDLFTDLLAVVALLQQSKTYGCHVQQSSAESNDEVLAKSLYDWTLNELTVNGY